MNSLIVFGLWYAFGLVVMINEMRHIMDVTFEKLFAALILAVLGPFWVMPWIERHGVFDQIVFKRKSRK